jgi:hypothetical protein
MLIGTVQGPVPVIVPSVTFPVPHVLVATVTLELVGAVHPAGTEIVACEPALKSLAFWAVKVKVKLFPVLPAGAVIGLTVIVPCPSLALVLSVNVICAWEAEPVAVK